MTTNCIASLCPECLCGENLLQRRSFAKWQQFPVFAAVHFGSNSATMGTY